MLTSSTLPSGVNRGAPWVIFVSIPLSLISFFVAISQICGPACSVVQATSVPFGVVNAPGQRYHPVVIAQAIATLGEMYPGRLTVALGSGEASNEHVTGDPWPPKPARNARLRACVDVIRALLRGEEVSTDGHVRVDRARLWTLPAEPVPLIGAALSEETARWCGGWADGLITVHMAPERLRRIIDAFQEGGGEGKPLPG